MTDDFFNNNETENYDNENISNLNETSEETDSGDKKGMKKKAKNNITITRMRFVIGLFIVVLATAIVTSAVSYTIWDFYSSGGINTGLHDPSFSFSTPYERETDSPPIYDRDGNEVLTVPEISELVRPSVVFIGVTTTATNFFGQRQTQTGAGSGIIISQDGYVMTNHHVIERADSIKVRLFDGRSYEAELVGSDINTDLAVVKINAQDLRPAVLGDSENVRVGELAVAIGNPLGNLEGSVTVGVVSAVKRSVDIENISMSLIQTDAALNPGNSGGALVNKYGEIIGVVNAKTSAVGIEGLGYAIPSNDAKIVVEDLITKGYVSGRIKIGIATQDICEVLADFYDLPEGIYIVDVEPESSADKAGLKAGDVIIGIDGRDILTGSELLEVRDSHEVGDEVKVLIIRDGEKMVMTLVFEEQRPE